MATDCLQASDIESDFSFNRQGLYASEDPFGRRLWKDVSGNRTYFMYVDKGLVAELNDIGTIAKSYVWQPNGIWGTDCVAVKENGQYYFVHNDHLGTPQKLTDTNGTTVWAATHSSFGTAMVEPFSMITFNLQFPGQYFDEETELHYNWFRFYSPRIGRYLQTDPIGFAGNLNFYAYGSNEPTNKIDPLGLKVWKNPYTQEPWFFPDHQMFPEQGQSLIASKPISEKDPRYGLFESQGCGTNPDGSVYYLYRQRSEGELRYIRMMSKEVRSESNGVVCMAVCGLSAFGASHIEGRVVKYILTDLAEILVKQGIKKAIPVYNLYSTGDTLYGMAKCVSHCFKK